MSNNSIWITTDNPAILFEDTEVGRLKNELWNASKEEIDAILEDYEIPSPPELGKPGSYIQTTPRQRLIENRRRNDIVLIPVGCTENHGVHTVSGLDSFMVTQIAEGVRRYTGKQGRPVNLVHNPLSYGAHPYHHIGMPGTVNIPQDVVKECYARALERWFPEADHCQQPWPALGHGDGLARIYVSIPAPGCLSGS